MIRLAVLGHPVDHSRSPAMHNAALRRLGIAGEYRAIDIPGEPGLSTFADALRARQVQGANITMPHKASAYRMVDAVLDDAARAGSVNTWFLDGGRLTGASTDISGLATVCERRQIPKNLPVTVVGAGGAARAAAVAFAERDLSVMARNPSAAHALVERCGVSAQVTEWGHSAEGSLIVNCTPLGMSGEEIPGITGAAAAIVDMAYGPRQTPAIAHASANGLPFADGIDVLVAQAAHSFTIWTGALAPIEVMEQAARNDSSR